MMGFGGKGEAGCLSGFRAGPTLLRCTQPVTATHPRSAPPLQHKLHHAHAYTVYGLSPSPPLPDTDPPVSPLIQGSRQPPLPHPSPPLAHSSRLCVQRGRPTNGVDNIDRGARETMAEEPKNLLDEGDDIFGAPPPPSAPTLAPVTPTSHRPASHSLHLRLARGGWEC